MFPLERATTVLLVVVGILLPEVFIQPAQGLDCYHCEPCIGDDPGHVSECPKNTTQCAIGEREYENGKRIVFRSCLGAGQAESGIYSCDKFAAFPEKPGEKLRVCWCDTTLCNEEEPKPDVRNGELLSTTDNDDSSSSQLLPFGFIILMSLSSNGLGRSWLEL
ncbi:hypothetical protein Ocin01_19531 [Orchesella cincta]|uniref:Protein sleepless n=1 Tax=Orchesella cincta TaxID=48709 RepID=A0A1D2M2K8_ORCCI|nr:hypothetical protein Ocin01_19531 [Orchesella cincta]